MTEHCNARLERKVPRAVVADKRTARQLKPSKEAT